MRDDYESWCEGAERLNWATVRFNRERGRLIPVNRWCYAYELAVGAARVGILARAWCAAFGHREVCSTVAKWCDRCGKHVWP